MLSDIKFLALCQQLSDKGIRPAFSAGEVVGRGFADLGFEEFIVLPGPKLLSLMAGTVSDLPESDYERFFLVPDADVLVQVILRSGGEILNLNFVDQREWQIAVSFNGTLKQASSRKLKDALIELII